MKKTTFLIFALFLSWQMNAQTGTVTIGTNDGTPNSSIGNPSPLQDNYRTQRIQMLYTAAELASAGLVAGPITDIGWVATALNASGLQENYTISMKSTSSTVLTATFETGASVVYGPTSFTPTAIGNVMFTLTTPFVWDGTSNVLIEICAGLATGTYTANVSCANFTTTGIQTVYYRNDTSASPCTQATGTTTTTKPVLVALGNVVSCLAPLNLSSSNVSTTTANVSWNASTSASVVGYEYVVSTSNSLPVGSGIATTNPTASLVGLLPQTAYSLFVRTNCGGTFSTWSAPYAFQTACNAVSTFPHLENFTTFLPNQCWSNMFGGDLVTGPTASAGSGWVADGFANNGTSGAIRNEIYTTGANDWIISPSYTIPATGYQLKFDAAAVQWNASSLPTTPWEADDTIEVLVSSTGTTNWTVLHTYNTANQPTNIATPLILDLSAYANQTVKFAFRAFEGATNGSADIDFSIDNFEIRLAPTCPDQTGLTIGNITLTGADTSWDNLSANAAVVSYEYAVTTMATPPATGTNTTNTYFIATGLPQGTLHYLHVRVVCSGNTYGNWASFPFRTLVAPPVNDNCATATVLPIGSTFASNSVVATNVGATGSSETAPGCGSYLGGDVWYSVVVPASGNVTVETGTNTGTTITDTGLAVYSGTCGALVLVECDDDDSVSGSFSLVALTGRVPGEVLMVRAWEYGNNDFNTFSVSAYDATLSSASFDKKAFLSYPNPIKNILNLSYKTVINNVKVTNLLGQEVLNIKANTNDVQVDTSTLATGTYIVNVVADNMVHTIKVVKE